MVIGVQQQMHVPLDELYRVLRRESEEALRSAQHGLADADFRRRVAVPASFPEAGDRPHGRRDAAGRPRSRWV